MGEARRSSTGQAVGSGRPLAIKDPNPQVMQAHPGTQTPTETEIHTRKRYSCNRNCNNGKLHRVMDKVKKMRFKNQNYFVIEMGLWVILFSILKFISMLSFHFKCNKQGNKKGQITYVCPKKSSLN